MFKAFFTRHYYKCTLFYTSLRHTASHVITSCSLLVATRHYGLPVLRHTSLRHARPASQVITSSVICFAHHWLVTLGHTSLRHARPATQVITSCLICFAHHWLVTPGHTSLRHARTASHVDMSCWHSVTHHCAMLTPYSGHWAMVTLRHRSLRHIYTASHITTPCWHCFYVTESHVVTSPYVIIHCVTRHYVMHPLIITTRLDWFKHSRFKITLLSHHNAIMFMLFHTRCSNSIHMTRSCAPLWSYGWQIWTDVGLQWDPDKYGGIRVVRVPYDEVWRPDILLYNKWVYTRQARWTKSALRLVCVCQWYQLRSGQTYCSTTSEYIYNAN